MMNREQRKEYYHNEAQALQLKIKSLKVRSRNFVIGEIASFLGIIFFIVLITLSDTTLARTVEGLLAVASFALYVVIRNRDVKNSELTAETERLCKAYQHEEAYFDGDFSAFDDGERYVNPQHPFTYDLDIFGKDSLYQRINRTVTTGGADRLAYYLSSVDAHKSIEEINEYREAIAALSADVCNHKAQDSKLNAQSEQLNAQRLEFISLGVDKKIDTDAILKSLPALKAVAIPSYYGGKGIKIIAWLLIIGLFASIVAAIYGLVNPMLPILWVFVNFFVVQGLANKYLKEMLELGNKLKGQMQPLMQLISLSLAGLSLSPSKGGGKGKALNTLKSNHTNSTQDAPSSAFPSPLEGAGERLAAASSSFSRLTNIVETLVLRGNDAYRFFADAFGLRGLFLVSKFYHWRNMASDNLPEWIDAVEEIDALVSMAQFRSNHARLSSLSPGPSPVGEGSDYTRVTTEGIKPENADTVISETTDAEIVDGDEVVYEAKGLYHPFLGEKAVRNDFSIKNHNFYIITGANMAGKSTFLRAVGVNYILAMNGMPVFADSFKVSRFDLFTSMRTSDDLAHGISYFNAELRRLKQLIKSLPPAPSRGGGERAPINTLKSKNANPTNGDALASAFPPPREGARERLASSAFPPPREGAKERPARERLIILDEILKGTNSLDKLNGSRMFLRAMEDEPVTGIIATHDLELSKMEQESPRFHNYCFEIELGKDVTYTYKISQGVARNQNATFLLKQLLEKIHSDNNQ